jgi:hypothetical protein
VCSGIDEILVSHLPEMEKCRKVKLIKKPSHKLTETLYVSVNHQRGLRKILTGAF